MSDFHLVEARPRTDWVYDALHELEVAVSEEFFGEDLSVSAEWNRNSFADERTAVKVLLLALPGATPAEAPAGRFGLPEAPEAPAPVLGGVEFHLPTADNVHLIDDVYIQVRADARRRGIGTALWREVERIGESKGRTATIAWSQHLAGAPSEPARVEPRTGVGHLPIDVGTRFAQSLGLTLAQVERESRLRLPVDPACAARVPARFVGGAGASGAPRPRGGDEPDAIHGRPDRRPRLGGGGLGRGTGAPLR